MLLAEALIMDAFPLPHERSQSWSFKNFGLQNMVLKVGSSRGWRMERGGRLCWTFEGKTWGTNGSFLSRAEWYFRDLSSNKCGGGGGLSANSCRSEGAIYSFCIDAPSHPLALEQRMCTRKSSVFQASAGGLQNTVKADELPLFLWGLFVKFTSIQWSY